MRISDWSSDVCSSDLLRRVRPALVGNKAKLPRDRRLHAGAIQNLTLDGRAIDHFLRNELDHDPLPSIAVEMVHRSDYDTGTLEESLRSEEHTSELQSLMRNSYAVFCLKKKQKTSTT